MSTHESSPLYLPERLAASFRSRPRRRTLPATCPKS